MQAVRDNLSRNNVSEWKRESGQRRKLLAHLGTSRSVSFRSANFAIWSARVLTPLRLSVRVCLEPFVNRTCSQCIITE